MGIFLMLICLLLGCQPVRAQEGSTAITVTVPKQPEEEIEAAAGAEILGDVPLPEGWEWKDGSISLKPGESVTGTAVYRDEDGNILAEREVMVTAPEQENNKYQPLAGSDSTWNGAEDAGVPENPFGWKTYYFDPGGKRLCGDNVYGKESGKGKG